MTPRNPEIDGIDPDHPRHAVPIGGFYAIDDEVFQRTSSETCEEHPPKCWSSSAMCCDMLVLEVWDIFPDRTMASRIANLLNEELKP